MKKIGLLVLLMLSLVTRGDILLSPTDAITKSTVLGGSATVTYDILQILSFAVNPQDGSLSANVQLKASSDSTRSPILGILTITTATGNAKAAIDIPGTPDPFEASIDLSGPQATAAQAAIADFVASIEGAVVNWNLVDGTVQ